MFLREISAPAAGIKGVGPALRDKLAACGITTVGGLLSRYPRAGRYEDHIRRRPLSSVVPGGPDGLGGGGKRGAKPARPCGLSIYRACTYAKSPCRAPA